MNGEYFKESERLFFQEHGEDLGWGEAKLREKVGWLLDVLLRADLSSRLPVRSPSRAGSEEEFGYLLERHARRRAWKQFGAERRRSTLRGVLRSSWASFGRSLEQWLLPAYFEISVSRNPPGLSGPSEIAKAQWAGCDYCSSPHREFFNYELQRVRLGMPVEIPRDADPMLFLIVPPSGPRLICGKCAKEKGLWEG